MTATTRAKISDALESFSVRQKSQVEISVVCFLCFWHGPSFVGVS